MKNKILVQICDKEYSIITEELEDYVKTLAREITKMIDNTAYKNLRTSKIDATMITCLELCDKIHKLTDDNDNMRREIKSYIDEIGKLSKKVAAFERQKSAKTSGTRNPRPEPLPEEELSEQQKPENTAESKNLRTEAANIEDNTSMTEDMKEDNKTKATSGFSDIDDNDVKTNMPAFG